MPKYAKLKNPYAANQYLLGAAIQSNKVYLLALGSCALAGIAVRQIN